jgi:hypothetical protein
LTVKRTKIMVSKISDFKEFQILRKKILQRILNLLYGVVISYVFPITSFVQVKNTSGLY